jgi:hypothetical protein
MSLRCGSPIRLLVVQKGEDVVGAEVAKVQIDDPTSMAGRKEAQEQHEGVAIALHGSGAEPSRQGKILREERAKRGRQARHRWRRY